MAKKKSLYGVHPGVYMVQKWVAELKVKTGRSLDEWIAHVKNKGPATEKERRDWLKAEHGLGTNSAWWIAERAEAKALRTRSRRVSASRRAVRRGHVRRFQDWAAADLRSIVEPWPRPRQGCQSCPCQTIVPLYRKHVFAQIKPTTRTRIDLGFALGDTKVAGRLIDTGCFARKTASTHRIPISRLEDIDSEVERWLRVLSA